ncbi:hypothetical protein [Pseudolysinimonas kribbensis]|uniref:hypothetical protein n=1 Tax=Pseudolysinimonas kribbensis TaxID=433641 RepID=UPI0024E0B5EE|nr:hypothetical protein [Pseudolysinimonas kribbensis]
MASRYEPSDGISELAELLRSGPRGTAGPLPRQRPPVDPARRRRRRRFALIATLIVTVVVVALLGSYAGFTLNAPVGRADSTLHPPAVPTPAAAEIALPRRARPRSASPARTPTSVPARAASGRRTATPPCRSRRSASSSRRS